MDKNWSGLEPCEKAETRSGALSLVNYAKFESPVRICILGCRNFDIDDAMGYAYFWLAFFGKKCAYPSRMDLSLAV